jgi:hypothetical protein
MTMRYEISVWDNTRGDVVKYVRDASEAELEALQDAYADEPGHDVVIDDEWEADDDEDD